MLLQRVTIEGFRSISGTVELFVRDQITCLIGANEHGKTNILEAVSRMTHRQFEDTDRNSSSRKDNHPTVTFHFELSASDNTVLLAKLREHLRIAHEALKTLEATSPVDQIALGVARTRPALYEAAIRHYSKNEDKSMDLLVSQEQDTLKLRGILWSLKSTSQVETLIGLPLPEARFFSPSQELVDTVTMADLEARRNLPFEGLLKLAGVWDEYEDLFANTIDAHRLHVIAGRTLTRRLRSIWTQGEAHTLRLSESAGHLRVSIEDPTTLDAPSRRSLGFRSFLSFALTLYAETDTFAPHGYILLFDEPGMHLHPRGQKDLLRELRKLAKQNQVIYTTHSPFLIDRNDPSSALLVRKELRGGLKGTRIVQKPYGDNWHSVTHALGITPSDAFFPPERVLIVEGTSDRLYVSRYMDLCKRSTEADLNQLHIVAADRRDELPGTARIFLAAGSALVVLVDADKGGNDFVKNLKRLAGSQKGRVQVLNMREMSSIHGPLSIEDLLPPELWVAALDKYLKDILGSSERVVLPDLLALKRGVTLGNAAAEYFTQLEVLKSPKEFSKTTVADLFCKQDLPVPQLQSSMMKLCEAITSALQIK